MDESSLRATPRQRHSERVDDALRAKIVSHRPADDLAAPGVDHAGEKDVALPARDVGDVRYPEPVRPLSLEAALHEIARSWRLSLAQRRLDPLAPARDTLQAELAQQASNALLSDPDAVVVGELGLDPGSAVGLVRLLEDPCDQAAEAVVGERAPRGRDGRFQS
jgi:hypothetical protein